MNIKILFGPLCAIRHGSYLCIYYTKMILMSILNINSLLDQRILRHRQPDDLDGVAVVRVKDHRRILRVHGHEGAAVWIL